MQTGERPLRWNDDQKANTVAAVDTCLENLSNILSSEGTTSKITEQFSSTLYTAVKPHLQQQHVSDMPRDEPSDSDDEAPRRRSARAKQPWFCETCELLRDEALEHLKHLRPNHEHELNKQRLEKAKTKYNTHKKQCKLN